MTGEAPHITLWINGTKLWEAQLPKNDQLGRRLRRDDWPAAALERDLHGRGRRQRIGLAVVGQRFRNMADQGTP